MPKLTTIKDYLSPEELHQRYRQSSTALESNHWQIIWLLSRGYSVKEVAAQTGFSPNWIRELARRYNEAGPQGLTDRRQTLPGVKPLLAHNLQQDLDQAIQQPHPDGGQWNGPKVAEWIAQKTGRSVRRQVGWSYLQKLDYALVQPRPHHALADAQAQAEFKKNCQSE